MDTREPSQASPAERRQPRRGVYRTVAILAAIALLIYGGFIARGVLG